MQVYIELALLENFCMDFVLLYAAKAATKNAASKKRIALASVFGACFAVVFPLFKLGAAWSVVLKILSGLLICAVGGKFKKAGAYVKFTGAFLLFTALLGGALIGVFSLAGINYAEGEGYILSSVPIGIPLFFGLCIILFAKKLAARLTKTHKNAVVCRIFLGGASAEIGGFFDSGNKVYLRGSPVSVIPEETAERIVGQTRIDDGVKIHTVAGSRIIKVFTADKMEVDFGDKVKTYDGVKIGISPQRINRAVLHCDLLEN